MATTTDRSTAADRGTTAPTAPGSTGTTSTAGAAPRRRIAVKQILATALIVIALVLGLENTQHVNIRLVGPVVNSPLWILVAASLVLGLLAGLLLGHHGRASRDARRSRKR